jgi:hypothetical protein
MGHADLAVAASKLMKPSCRFPDKLLHESQIDSALELARKYENRQIEVMFYIAPVPQCENANLLTAVPYSKLTAAPPKEIDAHYFDDDGYYIHLDRSGVPQATKLFLTAVLSALGPNRLNSVPMAASVSAPSPAARPTP